MVTFPSLPLPQDTSLAGFFDPVFESRFDGGAIATRSRFLAARALYTLSYKITMDEYFLLNDFFHDVRGRALTFDWTYPWTSTVTAADAGTPIGLTTRTAHGLRTGNQVIVSDVNATANGQRVITRTGTATLTLDGTSGGSGGASGAIARYFPKMRLVLPSAGWPIPTKVEGPPRDNEGVFSLNVQLEEDF